jgi:hypothetical protein
MMAPARTSETLVNFYQTTRRYNPEDSHLRTQRRENLKSYLTTQIFKQVSTQSSTSFNLSPHTVSSLDLSRAAREYLLAFVV